MNSRSSHETVVVTGHRAERLASRLCDVIGEFFYDVAHVIISRYGAYGDEQFVNGSFGSVPIRRCSDHKLTNYLQRSIAVARNAMKHHHLEKFEVCIVDSQEVSLFSIRISVKRIQKFSDEQLRALDTRVDDFRRHLSSAMLALQTMPISDQLRAMLDRTPTRPRIRLLTTTTDTHGMKKTYAPPFCNHILIPWSDPVENDFNQLIFTAFAAKQE